MLSGIGKCSEQQSAYLQDAAMTEIFHTVNAGLYISSGRTSLLIDGVHEGPSIGFSDMPVSLQRDLVHGRGIFARLDGLLFTHLHRDHYDAGRVRFALEKYPGTALWGPGLANRGISDLEEAEGRCSFRIGDFRIFAYETEHSGKPFREEPHRSLLIRNEMTEEAFLVSGDAIFTPELADIVKENAGGQGTVTAAFINIYHLIEEPSRAFLLRLAPGRLFLYHRPLPEDDAYNYLFMIRSELRRHPLPGYEILQPEHMSRVRY